MSFPKIHLGVYLMSGKEAYNATRWALEVYCSSLRAISVDVVAYRDDQRPATERISFLTIWSFEPWRLNSVRVDSAQMYNNEREVGQAIGAFLTSPTNPYGLKREDIHFTTKLASNSSYDRARRSIAESIKECGLGYIDLFLLHSPYGGKHARLESWRAVEDAIDAGEVKSGGVSNYGVKHVSENTYPRIS